MPFAEIIPEQISLTRRTVLGAAAAAAVTLTLSPQIAQAESGQRKELADVKAMTFDIQGTMVDYYRPMAAVGAAINDRKGLKVDWQTFLVDWTSRAATIIQAVIAGKRQWTPAGAVYREALDQLLTDRSLAAVFEDADRAQLLTVWGNMRPWPDVVQGLVQLRKSYTVAALSNAGMASVVSLSKRGGLQFDAVLTGELDHAYKPTPSVYQLAVTYLGFRPDQIMMVAAHKWDLKGAKSQGFKTAFVPRPLETGPGIKIDTAPEPFIDIIAKDLVDLAEKMAAA